MGQWTVDNEPTVKTVNSQESTINSQQSTVNSQLSHSTAKQNEHHMEPTSFLTRPFVPVTALCIYTGLKLKTLRLMILRSLHAGMRVCMHVCMHACMHVCIYVSMYLCMYKCI